MDISGKLIGLTAEQTGAGKNGNWRKISFIIETADQFPKKVCLDAWSDKADQVKTIPTGTTLNVGFDVESREFNGKWYTNLKAWRIDVKDAANVSAAPAASLPSAMDAPAPSFNEQDDLPF